MDIKEKMLPAPMDGGFRMEGYWVWCGSVAKGEDGKYHMLASRCPKWLPRHGRQMGAVLCRKYPSL